MTNARLLCLPLLAVLGACGGGAADAERKTAAGEVLGGSISDEMLPLDTVTSESPPLREEAEDGAAAATSQRPARAGGASGSAEDDGEPAPSPSATATPEKPEAETDE